MTTQTPAFDSAQAPAHGSAQAPKLRFPEFSDKWEVKKLGEIIKSIDSGWSPQCEDYPASSNEWGVLKTTSVAWEGFDESENKKLPDLLEPKKNIEVQTNDILITRAGPTNRVGVTVHVNIVRPKLLLSDKIIRIRTIKEYSSKFVAISLSNIEAQKQIVSKSSGLATSQTNISQEILLNVLLKCASLPEQTKIANFLTAIDEKIQALKQKKTLLEQYKKGVMQRLFSSALGLNRFEDDRIDGENKKEILQFHNPKNHNSDILRFKNDDGADFDDWEEKSLGEIASKKSSNISANKIEDNFGDFIIYGAAGVLKRVDFFEEENDYVSIVKDGAGAGRLLFCKGKSSVLGTMEIIKPKFGVNTYFLFYLLSTFDFTKYVTGSTIPHIYFKDYSLEICGLPSKMEQQKIANFLTAIDEKIEKVSQQITATETYKKGLLQAMFV